MEEKNLQIRNSTTDFLVFTKQAGEDGIEVRVHDENVWLTQKAMAELFDCSTDNIGVHMKNIFKENELTEKSTTEDFSVVQQEGTRQVKRTIKYYNLDAIISVGYRINSHRATQFRQWATKVLRTFTIQGYVLNKERLDYAERQGWTEPKLVEDTNLNQVTVFLKMEKKEDLKSDIKSIQKNERSLKEDLKEVFSSKDYEKLLPIIEYLEDREELHHALQLLNCR